MLSHFKSDQEYDEYIFPKKEDVKHKKTLITKLTPKSDKNLIQYKYDEDTILQEFQEYIDSTYGGHYQTETANIEMFDAWIALGDSVPTFRNTAMKYLWRYGKKDGANKKDLFKALQYIMMMLYIDHYKDKE